MSQISRFWLVTPVLLLAGGNNYSFLSSVLLTSAAIPQTTKLDIQIVFPRHISSASMAVLLPVLSIGLCTHEATGAGIVVFSTFHLVLGASAPPR